MREWRVIDQYDGRTVAHVHADTAAAARAVADGYGWAGYDLSAQEPA